MHYSELSSLKAVPLHGRDISSSSKEISRVVPYKKKLSASLAEAERC